MRIELSVIATELGENQGNYVEAGDFRIDFCIEENLGIAAFGTGFYYDSQHYLPVPDDDGLLFISLPAPQEPCAPVGRFVSVRQVVHHNENLLFSCIKEHNVVNTISETPRFRSSTFKKGVVS